ncbi:hypothetical protein SUGI_0998220 [Cryptomeria japonica]|nr:hypothetical protein SUGI_0998220 [Cryptomeria japonica]
MLTIGRTTSPGCSGEYDDETRGDLQTPTRDVDAVKGFHELHDKLVEVKQAVPKEGNTGSQGRGFGGYGSNHGGGNYGRMDNNMYKNATAGDRRGYTGYGPTGYAAPAPMQGNFAAGGYMNGGLRESKALWAWDIVSDNCGIYKSSIMELYV